MPEAGESATGVARYRVGDNLLAEDLTSETFEKAWRNRGNFRRDLAAFSTSGAHTLPFLPEDHLYARQVPPGADEWNCAGNSGLVCASEFVLNDDMRRTPVTLLRSCSIRESAHRGNRRG